jgi:hypothetical protein
MSELNELVEKTKKLTSKSEETLLELDTINKLLKKAIEKENLKLNIKNI